MRSRLTKKFVEQLEFVLALMISELLEGLAIATVFCVHWGLSLLLNELNLGGWAGGVVYLLKVLLLVVPMAAIVVHLCRDVRRLF